jgi:hypothetical protein
MRFASSRPRLCQRLCRAAPWPIGPTVRHSHAGPDCDEYTSASPSNAELNASRVRRRGRKLFARVPALRRSSRATCGREANPTRAANVLCLSLRPARDNDSARDSAVCPWDEITSGPRKRGTPNCSCPVRSPAFRRLAAPAKFPRGRVNAELQTFCWSCCSDLIRLTLRE